MLSRTHRRLTLLLLLAMIGIAIPGCSSFDRKWKAAAATAPPTDSIEGRWSGHWRSDVNDHNGKLRCIMTRLSPELYEARFHAKYAKILSFSYTARLNAQPGEGDQVVFQGESDLGWYAGGVYQYDGWATPEKFFCTYKSKHDHGKFEMTRPE